MDSKVAEGNVQGNSGWGCPLCRMRRALGAPAVAEGRLLGCPRLPLWQVLVSPVKLDWSCLTPLERGWVGENELHSTDDGSPSTAGTNGGLEFGAVRVMDEVKQVLSLKNKGKYEIGYRYWIFC